MDQGSVDDLVARVDEKEVLDAAQCLIRVPSVSGSETAVMAAASAWLAARGGVGRELARVSDRPNLVCELAGPAPGPVLAFNGHLDTVPVSPGERWETDPFGATVKDGILYGRGALDMKGACGAMMHAFALLSEVREKLCGRVQLQLVCDEERNAYFGTQFLLEQVSAGRLVRPDGVVIGEKSDLRVRIAERGHFEFRIVFTGRAAHTAVARVAAVNPILHAARAALRLDRPLEAYHPAVGHPIISVNGIEAGVAANQVPAQCTITVDRRVVPGETREGVLREVTDVLEEVRREVPELEYEIVPMRAPDGAEQYSDATMTPPDHPFVVEVRAAYQRVTGREAPWFVDWAGGTDARLFRAQGIPTVVLGAQGSGFHGANEHARVDSLVILARVYVALAGSLLGARAA